MTEITDQSGEIEYLIAKNTRALKVKKATARKFLLSQGYFPEKGVLPLKINAEGFHTIRLAAIDWSKPGKIPRTSSVDIVIDKDDKGLRRFSLIHPFAYIQLVNEVIAKYDEFIERVYRETKVKAYAIPILDGEENIKSDWRHFNITDPSRYFLDYTHIASADIYNFYESIYTHSISWAMHGKDIAKNNFSDLSMLGNRLDKLMQNSHDGQTNGIPTGNTISDLIAELILKDIDELLGSRLEGIDVKIFRFRDDYRFVSRDKKAARKALDTLALILNSEYGLTLNQQKTKIEAVEEYRARVSKPEYLVALPEAIESLQTIFIDWGAIHRYVEESKVAGKNIKGVFNKQIERLMETLRNGLANIVAPDSDDVADLLYSAVIDSIDSGISTTGNSFLLIDFVISKIKSRTHRARLIEDLYGRFFLSHNESNKLWAYATLLHLDSSRAELFARSQQHPLFKMISSTHTPNSEQFRVRDNIPNTDKEALKTLKIIRTNLIDDIATIDEIDYIFGNIDEKEFKEMKTSHYDW